MPTLSLTQSFEEIPFLTWNFLPDLVRTFALQRSKHGNDYKVALMVAGVLVLMFPEGWPRAWHRSEVLPVAVFHANS